MKSFNKHRVAIFLMLLVMYYQEVHALCGVRTLYRKNTDTTIHLLYDDHFVIDDVKVKDINQMSYDAIKKKFYPAEQRLLTAFERLDKQQCPYDLIWETFEEYAPPFVTFIGVAPRFIKKQFKQGRFVNADKTRNYFAGTFATEPSDCFPVVKNYCYDDIAPLSQQQIKKIRARSGEKAWKAYEHLYNETVDAVHDYFEDFYCADVVLDFERDFHKNDAWCSLCDVEMLAHILSSEKKKIIVFAGGWHFRGIAQFLLSNGFLEITGKGPKYFIHLRVEKN